MNSRQFISFVKKECEKNNVHFYRSSEAGIPDDEGGSACNGYFVEGEENQLAIATGKPLELWLPILLHEYSHMTQWREGSSFWVNTTIHGIDSSTILDLWIAGKVELTEKQKDKVFKLIMECEADCERRSVELIKKLKLPVDIEDYIQRANAYLIFHLIIRKTRKWYSLGIEPYNNPKIYKKMPKKIINVNKVDPKLLKAFKK